MTSDVHSAGLGESPFLHKVRKQSSGHPVPTPIFMSPRSPLDRLEDEEEPRKFPRGRKLLGRSTGSSEVSSEVQAGNASKFCGGFKCFLCFCFCFFLFFVLLFSVWGEPVRNGFINGFETFWGVWGGFSLGKKFSWGEDGLG